MSRARNIKPGFFKNDRLAECDPLARILFAALWCEADREGRLEDRPKRIKAECLPYDDADVDALLGQLERAGFIVRYSIGEARYIAVLNFAKHQNPHVREPASTIPAPDGTGLTETLTETAPGEHSASTVPAPDKPGTGPADSPSLIPDSREKRKGGRSATPLALPDWLSADAWDAWHRFRNGRKGWTADAKALSLRSLTKLRDEGHDPLAVIEQSIERGWTGLFPLRAELAPNARGSPAAPKAVPKQVQALHAILGVPHEADQSARVVLDVNPRGFGPDVHPEPRRLASG